MSSNMGGSSKGKVTNTGKPLGSIKHTQSKAVKSWIKNELKQQTTRFKKILEHMDEIAPKRDKWIANFLETITTRGTNIDGDLRNVVAKEDLPKKPKRKFRVTYESKDLKGFKH